MGTFDDLPRRDRTHDVAETAEATFTTAINRERLFLLQGKDQADYGTDFQLEAIDNGAMTNLRVHIQVKGTEIPANADGSVSIPVDRTNVNYLFSQPESVYICYHAPTERLLGHFVDDVVREYEHRQTDWQKQAQITVRMFRVFDHAFQKLLHNRVLAAGRANRDRRLEWSAVRPERYSSIIEDDVPLVEVPPDPVGATQALLALFGAGYDRVISKSFNRFKAVLAEVPGGMDHAYLAEINLGINRQAFDEERVLKGITVLREALARGDAHPGTILYCEGNAWLALKEFERARDVYNEALLQLDVPSLRGTAAQCSKNLGTVLQELGQGDAAVSLYRRALELDPDLGEAHFALAMWYHKKDNSLKEALHHFDAVAQRRGSALPINAVQGWRIEIFFELGDFESAFREIQNLTVESTTDAWIWPWCAFLVSRYGRRNVATTMKAVAFWRRYVKKFPHDSRGEYEHLLCLSVLKLLGADPGMTFGVFETAVLRQIDAGAKNGAFLLDRLGHWAQTDRDWTIAAKYFRKAWEIDPDRYGYCLGTALNFLRMYREALPILMFQATEAKGDAMCWFQVAVAKEGTDDLAGAIEAYSRAISLDEQYDLAWFNLGAIHWNRGDKSLAIEIWSKAIRRFPTHNIAARLRQEMPSLFPE